MSVSYTVKDWMVRFVLAVALAFIVPFCAGVFAQPASESPKDYSNVLERLQNRQLEADRNVMAKQRSWVPDGFKSEDAVMHPIIYWRAWLNQPWPVGRVIILLSGISVIAIGFQFFCPKLLVESQAVYERRWLRCLGVGLLVLVLGAVLTGVLARSGLYLALAYVLLAVVQGISQFGFCVAAKSIGKGFLTLTRVQKNLKGDLTTKYVPLLVGLLLCAVLLELSRFVPFLPGFGSRLLSLIASGGAGALLISLKQSKQS